MFLSKNLKKIAVIGGKVMEKELKKTTSRFDKFILGIGLIVGILGTFITFISNIEIYQLLRIFSIIIYLIYWYRDKNYKLKYLFMYIASMIGAVFILCLVAAFSIGILFAPIYGEFLVMILILIFIGVVFPILDSYLYQKFKIMSYTNEKLKKKMTVSENI